MGTYCPAHRKGRSRARSSRLQPGMEAARARVCSGFPVATGRRRGVKITVLTQTGRTCLSCWAPSLYQPWPGGLGLPLPATPSQSGWPRRSAEGVPSAFSSTDPNRKKVPESALLSPSGTFQHGKPTEQLGKQFRDFNERPMTLPQRPTPTHSREDPPHLPQCVLRPSWAPGSGRLRPGPVSPGRAMTGTSQSTLSPHCFQSAFWAPKPDRLVAPTALLPRGFRKGKVGHDSELRKGTRSAGRNEPSVRAQPPLSKASSPSVRTFCGETHSGQKEQHVQRGPGPRQVEGAGRGRSSRVRGACGLAEQGLAPEGLLSCSLASGLHSGGNEGVGRRLECLK